MKHFLPILLGCLLSGPLFGQEAPVLHRSFQSVSFPEFAREMEDHSDLRFFYRGTWIEDLYIRDLREGTPIGTALNHILKPKGLSFYREGNDLYIFPGSPIVTELPAFREIRQVPAFSPYYPAEDTTGETKFLQTKSISEEGFITIGNSRRSVPGKACTVKVRITNKLTGEALIGATIFLRDSGSGMISDADGAFQLRLVPGEYIIVVNHMAMKERQYGLRVLSDGDFTIELENELIELEEVTVTDTRHSNVQGMLMGYERITTKAMKEIPLVMGEKDVIKVAQMLPGVQSVGEGSSGINVRGGSADQNMFYINSISIYNTAHLFGFFNAFSPDIISDFSLYKNNIPARYGGRIASIFEINTRQGNKNNLFAQGGISPITGHMSVEVPLVKNKVSFTASARSTYSDWLLKRIKNQDISNSYASFYDGTAALDAELNARNRLELFFYSSSDRFLLAEKNEYSYSNLGASIHWKHRFSDAFSSDLVLSNSDYRFSNIDKNNVTEAFRQKYAIRHTEGRADFVLTPGTRQRIEFGVNAILYGLDRGNVLPYGEESRRIPIHLGREQGLEGALYLSDEIRLLKWLSVMGGIRYSRYTQVGPATVNKYTGGIPLSRLNIEETTSYGSWEPVQTYSGFEPRTMLNFGLGPNSSIKASYNRLQQYIFLLSNTIAIAPNDQWKLTDTHIRPPVSDQVSLGYYQDLKDDCINLSFEIYRKWIDNVVEYRDGADFISSEPLETMVLQGSQDAYGFETMLRKNTGKLTGWLSYTYSRSIVTVDGPTDRERINKGKAYPSNYDRPHSINLVSNFRVSRRISFSSNLVYTTGRPVTLPIAIYYSENQQYLLFSDRNAYRIPDYFRVDFSINLEGNLKFKKIAHSFWMLNVYNLTGRDNAYSVFYNIQDERIRGYKLSVFAQPIITLSWNFKFGNYNSN
ncbi:MAG: carboxypeptidase-like regulatory domain-containing protein [Bacteroidales bacterium]|nr:carboxypeptidase-like regulatory domain-containing protein [Bacteroidales bacterium]